MFRGLVDSGKERTALLPESVRNPPYVSHRRISLIPERPYKLAESCHLLRRQTRADLPQSGPSFSQAFPLSPWRSLSIRGLAQGPNSPKTSASFACLNPSKQCCLSEPLLLVLDGRFRCSWGPGLYEPLTCSIVPSARCQGYPSCVWEKVGLSFHIPLGRALAPSSALRSAAKTMSAEARMATKMAGSWAKTRGTYAAVPAMASIPEEAADSPAHSICLFKSNHDLSYWLESTPLLAFMGESSSRKFERSKVKRMMTTDPNTTR